MLRRWVSKLHPAAVPMTLASSTPGTLRTLSARSTLSTLSTLRSSGPDSQDKEPSLEVSILPFLQGLKPGLEHPSTIERAAEALIQKPWQKSRPPGPARQIAAGLSLAAALEAPGVLNERENASNYKQTLCLQSSALFEAGPCCANHEGFSTTACVHLELDSDNEDIGQPGGINLQA